MSTDAHQPLGSPLNEAAATSTAVCDLHGRPLSETCARCGDYSCPECLTVFDGQGYCVRCQESGKAVDYLEELRQKYWGKRDGWAWLFGLSALMSLLAVIVSLFGVGAGAGPEGLLVALFYVPAIVVYGGFFLGQRWARWALIALYVIFMLLVGGSMTFLVGAGGGGGGAAAIGSSLAGIAIAFGFWGLILYGILSGTRNKLFFKIDVSREQLYKLHLQESNRLASYALLFAIVGLIPIAWILAFIALRRVDMKAVPPVGGRGYAIIAILITLLYVAIIVPIFLVA